MVALILYGQEPQRFSINDMRGTTTTLKPRQRVTRLWLDELRDIADINGCSRVMSLGSPPTLDDIYKAIPTNDARLATTFHQLTEAEWGNTNTRLWFSVLGSRFSVFGYLVQLGRRFCSLLSMFLNCPVLLT
jgi:hypothetical protein